MRFKKLVGKLHLILGLVSGLVVFIVAVAAAILVFEEEGRELFQREFYHVERIGEHKATFKQMADTIKLHHPDFKFSSIRFKEKADAAVIFYSKKDRAISVDPYTSKIISVRNLKTDFFTVVLKLHTHLLMGEVGGAIVKANVLIFFIMCLSGLVLWLPKQLRHLKQALRIKIKAGKWKRLNYDLHSVLGFYAAIPLIIIAFTGMFFVYDSVKSSVAVVTNSPKPKKDKIKVKAGNKKVYGMDEAYQYMLHNYPGAIETFMAPPAGKDGAIRVQMRYSYTIVRQQNTLYFDPYTGRIIKADLFKNYNAYDKVAASNYNLHTGRFTLIGIWGKIIYFLVSLIAASLPVTGLIIWLNKQKKSSKKVKPAVSLKRELVVT
ncbi:hypothetical protein CKK33_10400 [Mucilaginibacter sp. MD40]|uniref:PepSY-associated TM helix domain-containing protein n=1 Tax=Mucilaginibacter sp. MD40 TaxID=2029590 RepID=UPI000BACC3B9|nr:PepSY-associated TM helix domain-containing protein [Mucilaginibacter sp. MD40]PAW93883.1 hypothetical protein CKK33_10400 [Mucilaginibacter sp. MD40]